MTNNQINYWNYRETSRHNVQSEKETKRHNVQGEKETLRHNVATETEVNRHNVVVEQETERHNRAVELLTSGANAEQQRHNLIVEAQTHTAQVEQHRSNVAQEELAQERNKISYAQIGLGYAQLGETIQHNRAQESTQLLSVREGQRHNLETETNAIQTLDETERANRSRENQQVWNYQNEQLRLAIEKKRLEEQTRHNKRTEVVGALGAVANLVGSGARLATIAQ